MLRTPSFKPAGIQPTAEQIDIQLARAKTVLVEANAGAAKTTTLGLRIGEAIARRVPPAKILALAFTDEAKITLRKRLIELGIPKEIVTSIHIETFESFARAHLENIQGFKPRNINNPDKIKSFIYKAIEKTAQKAEGRYTDLEISTHNVAISQFWQTQLSMKATMSALSDFEDMDAEEAADTIGVPLVHFLTFREYENSRLGVFDDEPEFRAQFDATYDLARRLSEHRESTTASLPEFRLVLCDELHDMNEASFRIITALLDRGQGQFVGAGDRDQVIFGNLGAHSRFLSHRFAEYDPSLITLPLTATFRYGPHLAYAIGNLKDKASSSPLALRTEITQLTYPAGDWEKCANLVIEEIQSQKQRSPKSSCAILLRNRHQSIALENALLNSEFGYESVVMNSYLQRDEILFLRGLIAIALNNLASIESMDTRKAIVEALACFSEVNLTPAEIESAKRTIANSPETLSWFFSGQIKHGTSTVRRDIVQVVSVLQSLPSDTPADKALLLVCQTLDIERLLKRIYVLAYEATVVSRSIQGFIASAQRSGYSLRAFSEWISLAEDKLKRKKRAQIVTLECIANTKGMEFDHVILPFLEAKEFPDSQSDYSSDFNLFYVGTTRAKHRLTLLTPKEVGKRSPFVEKLAFKTTANLAEIAISKANPLTLRTDLEVPYAEKDQAKALGAKWDPIRSSWYVPPGNELAPFKRWLQGGSESH